MAYSTVPARSWRFILELTVVVGLLYALQRSLSFSQTWRATPLESRTLLTVPSPLHYIPARQRLMSQMPGSMCGVTSYLPPSRLSTHHLTGFIVAVLGACGVENGEDVGRVASLREAEAEANGLIVDKKVYRLRTTKAFINYAKTHGATVKSKGTTSRMRVECNGVWMDLSTKKKDQLNSFTVKQNIAVLKAMNITFVKK